MPLFGLGPLQGYGPLMGDGPLSGSGPLFGEGPLHGSDPLLSGGIVENVLPISLIPPVIPPAPLVLYRIDTPVAFVPEFNYVPVQEYIPPAELPTVTIVIEDPPEPIPPTTNPPLPSNLPPVLYNTTKMSPN